MQNAKCKMMADGESICNLQFAICNLILSSLVPTLRRPAPCPPPGRHRRLYATKLARSWWQENVRAWRDVLTTTSRKTAGRRVADGAGGTARGGAAVDAALSRISPQPSDPQGLLFLAGHQPQMFHPGVWYKNFALGKLAAEHGQRPLI